MWNKAANTPEISEEQLAAEIAGTLRGVIHVPRLNPNSGVGRVEFWRRCRLVTPDWRTRPVRHIFVDGIANACHWNSWKVFRDSPDFGVTLWSGYAFYGGSWTEHSWCMFRKRIVETTAPFRIYFGARLTLRELWRFGKKYGRFDLKDRKHLYVNTMIDGERRTVEYDPSEYAASMGKERDPITRIIKEGLGQESS